MTTLGVIGFILAVALLLVDLCAYVYRKGREKGQEDADQYWIAEGQQVDQARQEIWREER